MPNYTDNLELFKYDVEADKKSTFNIGLALNDNFDKIDAKVGEMETQQANIDLSNLSTTGNSKLNAKANIDLSNLSTTGEKRFEDINTQIAKTVLQSDLYDSNGHIKIDKMSFPQIIESYISGTSGYFIWSNGFKQQWGRINGYSTLTFLKPFLNTNYLISLTPLANTGDDYRNAQATSLTTNNCFVSYGNVKSYTHLCSWYACGY